MATTITSIPPPISVEVDSGDRKVFVPDFLSTRAAFVLVESYIRALAGQTPGGVVLYGKVNLNGNSITGGANSTSPSSGEMLTFGKAQLLYAPSVMQLALSSLGANPLNVNNLHGTLADPQLPGISAVSSLPDVSNPVINFSVTPAQLVVIFSNSLFRLDQTTMPGKWKAITTTGIIPSGLRSAIPAPATAGLPYIETDLNVLYLDDGTNYRFRLGFAIGTNATRLALVIGANDNGLLFYETDTNVPWFVSAGAFTKFLISLTGAVTGVLPVANGGTATSVQFTQGSMVFVGASGVYNQDNANLFWDSTNKRLGIQNAVPAYPLDVAGEIATHAAGQGFRVKEGANARMGVATLAAGTSGAIANTSITANTRIFTSVQAPGGTQGFLSAARVAGTSFTINSTSGADTSTVAWLLLEPA